MLRLLALSPRLALHAPLLLIAAGAGALAGIGYTFLVGRRGADGAIVRRGAAGARRHRRSGARR